MESIIETYTILKESKNNLCHIVLRVDGILQVSTMNDVEYGKEEATEVIKSILKIAETKQYHILILSGKDSNVTIESMKLISSPIAMSYAIAKAYVIDSLPQKLMANFYLKVLNPKKPVKFFKTQTDAESWLKSL